MQIPVYLFTGFLDSGKTTFIQGTLEDARFNSEADRTLVLLCEEGETELQPTRFAGKAVFIEPLDSAEQLNPSYLTGLLKKHKAKRVLVEYNGMWKLDDLYNGMPKSWTVSQEFHFADATTYAAYNANMRELVVDKLRSAELVVFNRADRGMDKMALHKIVRGISRRAEIAYEYSENDVEYDDIEDPLPFDVNAPVIEIEDGDYALWYRDLSENLAGYDGKAVKFKGQVVRERSIPDGAFIIGRQLMTCCADDIRFAGLACEWAQADTLKSRDWVTVEASVEVREHPCYGRPGPVLTALQVEAAQAPEQPVATFY